MLSQLSMNKMATTTSGGVPVGSEGKGLLRGTTNAYIHLLTAVIVVICFLDLANYLNLIVAALLPKYIYALIFALSVPIIIMRRKSLLRYVRTYPVIWLYALAALNLIHWFVHVAYGNQDAAMLTLTRIQFLLVGLVFAFVLTLSDPRYLGRCFVVTAVMLSGLQLLDFTVPGLLVPPGTEGVVPGRTASTLLNANKAAESLVLLFVLGAPVLTRSRRLWLFAIVFPGVLVTFSRAGIMISMVVLLYCFAFRLVSRKLAVLSAGIAVCLLVIAGNVFMDDLLGFVSSEGLADISNRIMFFSDPNFGDSSANERLAVAEYAFLEFLGHPIIGAGSGFTSFWGVSDVSTHNMQLMILAEYGILGYMLLLWLFVLILKGGSYFDSMNARYFTNLFAAVFVMFTLFTHNMYDFLYWLLAFLLVCHRGFISRQAR